jgi:hypothetical protein
MNAEQERITKLAVELTKQLSLIPEGALSATLPKEMLLIIALVCSYVEKTSLRSDTQLASAPVPVTAPKTFGDLAVGDLLQFSTLGTSCALDRVVYIDHYKVTLVDEEDGGTIEMVPSETLESRKRAYVGNVADK